MQNITIIDGTYKIRGNDTSVAGLTFPLVEEFKMGARGGYVTVDGTAVAGFPDRNIKIKVSGPEDYELADKNAKIAQREESDEEIIERIRTRFDMLKDMTWYYTVRSDQRSNEPDRTVLQTVQDGRQRQGCGV